VELHFVSFSVVTAFFLFLFFWLGIRCICVLLLRYGSENAQDGLFVSNEEKNGLRSSGYILHSFVLFRCVYIYLPMSAV
jgi:hypothetical protein